MSLDWQELLYAVDDRVATITLNRPDRLNAYTQQMGAELREALAKADADAGVRAIVLTGAGRGFCAGADMARLSSAAAGIGFVITLYCDIRYMAAGAKLTTSFARRGLIAEHGASWMLPRLIGPMNALDLLCSARAVEAEEAERMGLVRVLPADGFLAAVQARAAEIANLSSPRSVRIIKKQVYEAMFQSLAEATRIANREQEACRDTEDFREGIAHYLEKRKPNFTGR